uniref:Uncharacterized protein n=1 Tax=Aureoumbra lagunensis TaxID=44058 RepID=A0A7S3NJV1_9STRA
MALFSFTENRVQSILDEVEKGELKEGEAVLDLLREEELLQEIKSKNVELIEFLSSNVDTILEYVEIQRTEQEVRDTALEVLCGFDEDSLSAQVAQHAAKIFKKLFQAKSTEQKQKWEQLLLSVADRHRYTLSRCVNLDIYNHLLESIACNSIAQVFSALFIKRPVLLLDLDDHTKYKFLHRLQNTDKAADNTARLALEGLQNGSIYGNIAGSLIATAVAAALTLQTASSSLQISKKIGLINEDRLATKINLATVAIEKHLLAPEDAENLFLSASAYMTAMRSDKEHLGLARLAIARLARVSLSNYAIQLIHSRLFRLLLESFFTFSQHSLLHRSIIDLCISLFDSVTEVHDENQQLAIFTSQLLFGDLNFIHRIIFAYNQDPNTSLAAHIIILAEALALSIGKALINEQIRKNQPGPFSLFQRHSPQCYQAFLHFLTDDILVHTLRRTTDIDGDHNHYQQQSRFDPILQDDSSSFSFVSSPNSSTIPEGNDSFVNPTLFSSFCVSRLLPQVNVIGDITSFSLNRVDLCSSLSLENSPSSFGRLDRSHDSSDVETPLFDRNGGDSR